MVSSTFIKSPNFRSQAAGQKKFIVLHWMVGNLRGTDSAFQRASYKVATHYGIEGDVIHQYVLEKDYAFASGTAYANRHGVAIEHAGGWLLPNGTRFKPSEATHETSAQLCAAISRSQGLGRLVLGQNVFGHNKFVATQCPGTLDMQWIVNRANQILGVGGGTPVTSAPAAPTGPALQVPVIGGITIDGVFGDQSQKALQRVLGVTVDGIWGNQSENALQRFLGVKVDGIFGSVSIKALQRHLGVTVDGDWGTQTTKALQTALGNGTFLKGKAAPGVVTPAPSAPASSNKVTVDGIWGDQSQKAVQAILGVTVDGIWGDESEKALQRKLGVPADGNFGPVSIKALQRKLGIHVDGDWGSQTTTALQKSINAGTF